MKKTLVLVISLILILSSASLAYAGEDACAPQPDPASQESHEEPQQESQLESQLELLQESNRESGHESDQPACTLHPTPVIQNGEQIGSMNLRFYSDTPHVAYYGMKDYLSFLRQEDLTVTENGGGIWEVSAPNGASIQVDPAAGTITAPDWALFQSPLTPYDTLIGVKDSPCAWTIYPELIFDDEPQPVVFDFAKYGIKIHADADDIYLPLALLSTMFTDMAANYVTYNGEKVFRQVLDVHAIGAIPEGYYDTERFRALLTGEAKREKDEILESYGELCFIMDHFFGHPGVGAFDESIRDVGLDETLKLKDESIRTALLSDDMVQYLIGMRRLISEGLDDGGHTRFTGISPLIAADSPYPELAGQILPADSDFVSLSALRSEIMEDIMFTRMDVWGDEVYRECGSTAIIRLDIFYYDPEGWEAYYADTADIPTDTLGITLKCLAQAKENPEITNILFDLTTNAGGSNDVLSAILDLTTGYNVFRGVNVLTGQHQRATVLTDKNLDGVFDEKDEDVKYDFRYAVLTSRDSFSCGNLFPVLMQENGALLIGEPSGGGSCAIQFAALSDGIVFQLSSYLWAEEDADGESVESGCKTDIPIARIEPEPLTYPAPLFSSGDYSPYFDEIMLDQIINEWFR